MFVGTTGVDRVVERTAQLMVEHDTDDVAAHGAIPLDVIQKYLNFHYSRVASTCSAARRRPTSRTTTPPGSRAAGMEERRKDDHRLTDDAIDGRRAGRRRRSADRGRRADRAQHRPAPRVHRRLPERRQAVEPDPRGGRPAAAAGAAARRVQPQGRRVRRHRGVARTASCSRPTSGSAQGPSGCRPTSTRRTSRSLMQPGVRARQDRRLDRARRATASTASRSTTTTSTSS